MVLKLGMYNAHRPVKIVSSIIISKYTNYNNHYKTYGKNMYNYFLNENSNIFKILNGTWNK